jgi:DNA-binding cell septation regulator SpoVG
MSNDKSLDEQIRKGIVASGIANDDISETKISEIKIFPIRNDHGLVGIASFILDDKLYCGSIGIYYENNKYRLTYPTKKYKNNNMTLFHPINVKAGEVIFNTIIKEYENMLSEDM